MKSILRFFVLIALTSCGSDDKDYSTKTQLHKSPIVCPERDPKPPISEWQVRSVGNGTYFRSNQYGTARPILSINDDIATVSYEQKFQDGSTRKLVVRYKIVRQKPEVIKDEFLRNAAAQNTSASFR